MNEQEREGAARGKLARLANEVEEMVAPLALAGETSPLSELESLLIVTTLAEDQLAAFNKAIAALGGKL